MDKRILWSCIAALGVLMLFSLLAFVFDARLNRALVTPLGELPLFDLIGVIAATAVGGAIGGRRFRWIAVAMMGVVWLLTLATLFGRDGAASLGALLRYNALSMALTLALAWLGAQWGERLAAQRRVPAR